MKIFGTSISLYHIKGSFEPFKRNSLFLSYIFFICGGEKTYLNIENFLLVLHYIKTNLQKRNKVETYCKDILKIMTKISRCYCYYSHISEGLFFPNTDIYAL